MACQACAPADVARLAWCIFAAAAADGEMSRCLIQSRAARATAALASPMPAVASRSPTLASAAPALIIRVSMTKAVSEDVMLP